MDREHSARRAAGIAAALLAVSIWAGWIPVTRLGVVTRLSPADVAALRFGTAGLVLAPLLALRIREVPWHRPWPLLAMLVGAGVPYFLLFAYGLRLANSGQGGVLGPGATSAFAALLAWLALGERPNPRRLAGLALTAAGVAVVVLHDALAGATRVAGFALILCASLGWAAYTVASRALLLRPVVNAATVAVLNALLFVPAYLAFGGAARLARVPLADLALQAFYQGILAAIVALAAFAFAIARLGAAAAAGFAPLSPVLVAGFGWLLLGDTVDAATAAGLAAVAAGVVIANGGVGAASARR
ncbi:MAG TPA: DMT family transporter [Steroidobacteraceae bacterium]|nr:DMT family transporter [Steroidobacteraceae bacterium]